jgi:hypothetical protein
MDRTATSGLSSGHSPAAAEDRRLLTELRDHLDDSLDARSDVET